MKKIDRDNHRNSTDLENILQKTELLKYCNDVRSIKKGKSFKQYPIEKSISPLN